MSRKSKEPTKFIAMWDNTGLECIIDVDKHEAEIEVYEKEKVWNILQDKAVVTFKPKLPLQQMILRARANSQRHYEIYGFTSTEGEKFVRDMFENDPQTIVNWIRDNGSKIYSERMTKEPVIV